MLIFDIIYQRNTFYVIKYSRYWYETRKKWVISVACLTFHWFVLPFHQSFCLCTLDILQILQHAGWRLLIAFLGQRPAFSLISSKWFPLLAQQPLCNQRDVFPNINEENLKMTILQWYLHGIMEKYFLAQGHKISGHPSS